MSIFGLLLSKPRNDSIHEGRYRTANNKEAGVSTRAEHLVHEGKQRPGLVKKSGPNRGEAEKKENSSHDRDSHFNRSCFFPEEQPRNKHKGNNRYCVADHEERLVIVGVEQFVLESQKG